MGRRRRMLHSVFRRIPGLFPRAYGPFVRGHGQTIFLFPFYDAWTTVLLSPGSRATGRSAQTILIAGPSWHGSVPAGMTLVKSPTKTAFISGRVYSDGTFI